MRRYGSVCNAADADVLRVAAAADLERRSVGASAGEISRRPAMFGLTRGVDVRVDARNTRADVEVGRAHDALRVNRRTAETGQTAMRRRSAPTPRAASSSANWHDRGPWDLGLDALVREALARLYGAATARLTIFSPCSLLIRPATSSFDIGLVAELQPKHAALGAVDDRGLIGVEQRGDVGDAGIRREPHQRARRRFRPQCAGDRLVRAQRRGLERGRSGSSPAPRRSRRPATTAPARRGLPTRPASAATGWRKTRQSAPRY